MHLVMNSKFWLQQEYSYEDYYKFYCFYTWSKRQVIVSNKEFSFTSITVRGLTRGRMLISEFCTA